jgi:hypothetical protein
LRLKILFVISCAYAMAGRFLSAAPLPETHRMIGRSPRLALISGRTAIFGLFTKRPFPNVSYQE